MITAPPPLPLSQLNWGKWFSWERQNQNIGYPCLFDTGTKENSRAGRTSSQQFSSKCPAKTGQLLVRGSLRRVCYYPYFTSRDMEVKWPAPGQRETESKRERDGWNQSNGSLSVHLRLTQTCIWSRNCSIPRLSCPARFP